MWTILFGEHFQTQFIYIIQIFLQQFIATFNKGNLNVYVAKVDSLLLTKQRVLQHALNSGAADTLASTTFKERYVRTLVDSS